MESGVSTPLLQESTASTPNGHDWLITVSQYDEEDRRGGLQLDGRACTPGVPVPDGLKSQMAREEFVAVAGPLFSRWLQDVGKSMKRMMLHDPDMPDVVKSNATAFLDHAWWDIQQEITRGVQGALLGQYENSRDKPGPRPSSTRCAQLESSLLWIRRAVLFHYLPFDKTIWGKFKDPIYVVFYMITLIPVHGVRVLFFLMVFVMLALPGPVDEYQLISFILLFKGTQFVTSGIVQMAMGSMKYFTCHSQHRDDGAQLLQCLDTRGPGQNEAWGLGLDYIGSTLLVWTAFALLLRLRRSKSVGKGSSEADKEERAAGGRLRNLVYYDMKCFLASFLLLIFLTIVYVDFGTDSGWWEQFCANVFWCCVLYSLLSLPFFFFTMPGLQTLLTHCDNTGYNEQGACVPFEMRTEDSLEQEKRSSSKSGSADSWSRRFRLASTVISALERGRQRRADADLSQPGDWQFSDLFRGWRHADPVTVLPVAKKDVRDRLLARKSTEARLLDESFLYEPVPVENIAFLDKHCSKDASGRTSYCAKVTPVTQTSWDSSGDIEPWLIFRYYSEFRALAQCLGGDSWTHFPGKKKLFTKAMKDQRRDDLQKWLQETVQRIPGRPDYDSKVYAFLHPRKKDAALARELLKMIGSLGSYRPPSVDEPQEEYEAASDDEDEVASVATSAVTAGDDRRDPRFDFGVSFHLNHCAECQEIIFNRGCERCETRLCLQHYAEHRCSPSSGDPGGQLLAVPERRHSRSKSPSDRPTGSRPRSPGGRSRSPVADLLSSLQSRALPQLSGPSSAAAGGLSFGINRVIPEEREQDAAASPAAPAEGSEDAASRRSKWLDNLKSQGKEHLDALKSQGKEKLDALKGHGKEARGAGPDGDYQLGDVTRGLLARINQRREGAVQPGHDADSRSEDPARSSLQDGEASYEDTVTSL